MLPVIIKVKMKRFLKLHEFVSLLKLESSRNVTSTDVISNCIKIHRTMVIVNFSFASTPHVTQWSANQLTHRAEILTR